MKEGNEEDNRVWSSHGNTHSMSSFVGGVKRPGKNLGCCCCCITCAFLPPPLWIERQGVFVYLCCVCVCTHEYWATVSYSLTCRACQVGSVVMHFVAVELNLHRFIYWEKKPQRDLEDLQRETLSGSRAGSITTNSSYTSLDKKLQ